MMSLIALSIGTTIVLALGARTFWKNKDLFVVILKAEKNQKLDQKKSFTLCYTFSVLLHSLKEVV